MGLRRAARQRALQFLYALEFSGNDFDQEEAGFIATNPKWRKGWKSFARELALKTHERRRDLDAEIAKVLENWETGRLASMDRICLRMALCEFREFPEIPIRATMDEYIELAKLFGTEDSPGFVNGVLDRLARGYAAKDFSTVRKQKTPGAETAPGAGKAGHDERAD